MSIVDFLTARLDEDEAVARAVLDHADLDADSAFSFNAFDPDPAAYMRRFTPQRVLADIAAKREIVEVAGGYTTGWPATDNDADMEMTHILEALASAYSDHVDYQQEWKL